MITADKVFKGNTEIVKIFKGLNLEWEKPLPIPSADAYVQDGLVFHLDGIDKGNVEGAWVDLTGNYRELTLNDCIINSDNIEFKGTDASFARSTDYILYNTRGGTILVVFSMESINGTIIQSDRYVLIKTYKGSDCWMYSGFHEIPMFLPNSGIHTLSMGHRVRTVADCVSRVRLANSSPTIDTEIINVGTDSFKGKIYSIRVYKRTLTKMEILKNQFLDILRFNIPGYETVNLTIEGDDGKPIKDARFLFLGNLYTYDGNPMTLKVPKGTYYQLDFACVPDYAPPEFLGPYLAEENNIRNIKAIYTYDGWGDYFVSSKNRSGSTAEIRDGKTYYKSNVTYANVDATSETIYHIPNTNFPIVNDNNKFKNVVSTIPHIYTATMAGSSALKGNGYQFKLDSYYNYVTPVALFNLDFRNNKNKYTIPCSLNSSAGVHFNVSYSTSGDYYFKFFKFLNGYLSGGDSSGGASYEFDTIIISETPTDSNYPEIMLDFNTYTSVIEIPNLLLFVYSLSSIDLSKLNFKSKEGLVKTLITNSFDRSKYSELSPVTIKLSSTTKSYLTDTDIALITNKGYTIA